VQEKSQSACSAIRPDGRKSVDKITAIVICIVGQRCAVYCVTIRPHVNINGSRSKRRVLIPVLGSQPAGDRSHKPGGGLSLLSVRPAVTFPVPAIDHRPLACTNTARQHSHGADNSTESGHIHAPTGSRIRDH